MTARSSLPLSDARHIHRDIHRAHLAPPLVAPREAARRLDISYRTLMAWAAAGRLPHVRCGRLIRFDPRDLEAFIDANRVEAAPARRRGRA